MHLPAELLHRIFSQCSLADIRSLRGVNRLSLAIANGYLLKDINLFFLKDEYETIANLVRDPVIAKGIRSLTLEGDAFDLDMGFEVWYDERNWQAKDDAKAEEASLWEDGYMDDSTRRQLEDAHSYCLALSQEQSHLLHNWVVKDGLLEIFRACTKLDTVVIASREVSSPVVGQHFRKAMVGPWVGRNNENEEQAIHQRINGFLFSSLLEATQLLTKTGSEPLYAVRLLSLDLDVLPDTLFEMLKSPEARKTFPVMDTVLSLKMILSGEWDDDRASDEDSFEDMVEDEEEEEQIARETDRFGCRIVPGKARDLLQLAPRLQELSLEAPDAAIRYPFRDAIPSYTFPSLTKIRLAGLHCVSRILIDFLHRHGNTLVELSMIELGIDSRSSWQETFQTIAGTLPRLEAVRLRGLFQGGTGGMIVFTCEGEDEDEHQDEITKRIQRYIIHGDANARGPYPSIAS